jgi:ABC-type phosphate/phosphonate transport system substrate-binding protein
MNKSFGILVLIIIVSILVGCKYPVTPIPSQTEVITPCAGPAVTFGEISDDPNEVTTSKQPFANYMAEQLTAFGFECGKIKVVDTIDEMITLMKNGEVDIYMDSIYPAMLVSDATDAQPILRRWRNCDPDYFSVLFTTADSGITAVEELAGHMVAMDQIYSTSGFVLPAVYLIDHGLNLVVKDSYDEPVGENEVGIYFSFDDKNTLNLVLEGKVNAGATDDYYFNKWEIETQELEPPITLVKLAETASVPRQVVLLRPGLGSDLQTAIKDKLSNAHLNPAGLSAMKQDADTCKYDDTPDGIEATFTQMQAMHSKIIEIPGWQAAFSKDQ